MLRLAAIAGLSVLLGSTSVAAEGTESESQDKAPSVEEARRALQQVPLNEKGAPAAKTVSPTLPTATMFRLGESPLPARDKASGKQGWLIDEQVGENTTFFQDSAGADRRPQESGKSEPSSRNEPKPDALTQLLPQWLGKTDLPGSRTDAASAPGAARRHESTTTGEFVFGAEPTLSPLGARSSSTRHNPYLESASAGSATVAGPALPTGAPLVAIPLLPGARGPVGIGQTHDLAPTASLDGRTSLQSGGTDLAPKSPTPPPPTAPIVDDRKYFPQLRRF